MRRIFGSMLFGLAIVAAAGTATASTSLLGAGETNWFYACAQGQPMNVVVRHLDQTVTEFTILPGQHLRSAVQLGDVEAWRCGGPVAATARYLYVVTLPMP